MNMSCNKNEFEGKRAPPLNRIQTFPLCHSIFTTSLNYPSIKDAVFTTSIASGYWGVDSLNPGRHSQAHSARDYVMSPCQGLCLPLTTIKIFSMFNPL